MKDASLKASPSLSGVIIDKNCSQRMIGDRKSKAAGKTILAEIDEQFERKVGDLTDLLIDKLFELTNGKTSQGSEELPERRCYSERREVYAENLAKSELSGKIHEQVDDR